MWRGTEKQVAAAIRRRRIVRLFCLVTVVCVLLAAITVPASVWAVQRVLWWTPAGQSIGAVIQNRMVQERELIVPPSRYAHGSVPRAVTWSMRRRVWRGLPAYFTGPLLTFWQRTLDRVISEEVAGGLQYPVWHVSAVDLESLEILPWMLDRADASVQVTFTAGPYSTRAGIQAGQISKAHYDFHLVRLAGAWRIERETFRFVDGYGP